MPSFRPAWSVTASGTTTGATATAANPGTPARRVVTWVSGWSDAATTLQIKNGSVVVWQVKLAANTPFHAQFPDGIEGSPGNAVSAVIATSTAACDVNLGGYVI